MNISFYLSPYELHLTIPENWNMSLYKGARPSKCLQLQVKNLGIFPKCVAK